MSQRRISVGLDLPQPVESLASQMDQAAGEGFDFICSYVIHEAYKKYRPEGDQAQEGSIVDTFTDNEPVLNNTKWSQCVVSKPNLDMSDYPDNEAQAKETLERVISFASHFSIPVALIPCPDRITFGFARTIYHLAQEYPGVQIWVHVKLSKDIMTESSELPTNTYSQELIGATVDEKASQMSKMSLHSVGHTLTSPNAVLEGSCTIQHSATGSFKGQWELWNNLRTVCEYHPNISVCLELGEELPVQEKVNRWLGEPVKALILPTKIFVENKQGYPTLSKQSQELVKGLYRLGAQFIIRPEGLATSGLRHYLQYVAHVISRLPNRTDKDEFEEPYYDVLQSPLQPLKDHLEASTYEVFETDPVKYMQYQRALDKALEDATSSRTIVVMVVGAGRGPLVRCTLKAASNSNKQVKVYAVEKNPNAIITLRNLKRLENWGNRVDIIHSDMREWNAPKKADIIVSELLGSFGDNELSPECLDGAQQHLKEDGISIPTAYTSYATPIASSKLWNEVYSMGSERKHFETPYVVKLHNHHCLSDPQPCFTFVHPNGDHPANPWKLISEAADSPSTNLPPQCIDNTNRRTNVCRYKAQANGVVHGFAGYFDAQLYKDVYLSIHPLTHSPEMFSWFPLFIPVRIPFRVLEGDTISFHISREVSTNAVWYEWAAAVNEEFVNPIHNADGRSYNISL